MVSYSRIASQVYEATINFESATAEIDGDKIQALDINILQWSTSIPESLRFNSIEDLFNDTNTSRGQRRLQVILHLRTNQMRTQIYRPVLHSATGIMENLDYAQRSVNVAKETIRTLSRLNEATDIYRSQQVCFNYFLVSALAVLFLAVAHAPNEFSRQVRDEFYQALDLVNGFSNKSYVARRMWNTIKDLRDIGPKLGLISRQTKLTDANDRHSSAAVAMAGLAGHHVDEIAAYASAHDSGSLDSSPLNGQQMSYELTNLFEAAGGYAQAPSFSAKMMDGTNGYASSQRNSVDIGQSPEAFSGFYGSDGQFSRIVGNLI